MKGTTERKRACWGRAALGMAALILSACADGAGVPIETPKTPSLNPPQVEYFRVTRATDPADMSETGLAVAYGEGIVLSWKVSGATEVSLSSASGTVDKTVDAAGEETVAALTGTETFTLTASNQDATVPRSLTVTVAAAPPVARVVSFVPEITQIDVGQSTKLCFVVEPQGATVTVTEKSTGTAIALDGVTPAIPVEASADETTDEAAETTEDTIEATDSSATDEDTDTDVPAFDAFSVMKLSLAVPPRSAGIADEIAGDDTVATEVTETEVTETDTADVELAPEEVIDAYAGCTVPVSPQVDTTYVLTVTDATGASATAETVVAVLQQVSVTLTADRTSLSGAGPVTLSWQVVPADATVVIDGVGDVTDKTIEGIGTITNVYVDEAASPRIFTITATDTRSSRTADAKVTITVVPSVLPTLTLSADVIDVFAGESVTLTVSGMADGVQVTGSDGSTQSVENGTIAVIPQDSVVYSATAQAAHGDSTVPIESNKVFVRVRRWDAARGKGAAWTAVGIAANDPFRVVAGDEAANTAITVGASTADDAWKTVQINAVEQLQTVIKGGLKLKPEAVAKIGPFPVNGFAFDPSRDDGKRVYAAVTGMLLYSQDGGASWKTVDVFPTLVTKKNKKQKATLTSYASCKGRTQDGLDGKHSSLVNVKQLCAVELVFDGEQKRAVIATDHGVYTMDNIDGYIDDRKKGTKWMASETLGSDVIVHGLAQTRVDAVARLYAATDRGVYVNNQGGQGEWQPLLGITGADGEAVVYAVAVDEAQGVVYAGTADGTVFRSTSLTTGEWTAVNDFDAPVYDIAADGTTGTILVGAAGVQVSRDQGATWRNVSAAVSGDGALMVYAVDLVNADGALHFAAATNQGVYLAHDTTTDTAATVPPPAEEPAPGIEPVPLPMPLPTVTEESVEVDTAGGATDAMSTLVTP